MQSLIDMVMTSFHFLIYVARLNDARMRNADAYAHFSCFLDKSGVVDPMDGKIDN